MTEHLFEEIVSDVELELASAIWRFPAFNSAHEGFAILKEEVDELWEEVRAKQGKRDVDAMYNEAKQISAMAQRFMLDVCKGDRGQK